MDVETAARLDSVVTDYLLAVERGESPDQAEILSHHADIADELREFFAADAGFRRTGAAPPSAMPEVPQLSDVGKYALLEEIARGGMGIVYRARHRELNRVVALKMLLSGTFASPEQIRRFYGEAESAARLNHAGIVPIHEVGEHEGHVYYTMSFVEGESLAGRIGRGPLPPDEAAELLARVARAVAHAHDQRVLHRDLKPANILLDADGQPHITDFGVAKSLDDGHGLTATGEIIGTLQFMAPEQAAADHETVSIASDVYSLGAILYAALTGRPVFTARSQVDLLLQVLEREPRSPREVNPATPRELEAICLRCLEKDPTRRYPSARALAEDLERYLTHEPALAGGQTLRDRIRRRVRKQPFLAAHVGTLLLVDLLRQTKYLFGDQEFRPQFSLIFLVWIGCCFGFQHLLTRPGSRRVAPYLWSSADVVFLSISLYLLDGPIDTLLVTFAMLVVVSGMFLLQRLVFFVTVNCLTALVVLTAVRSAETPRHYVAVFAAVLIAISVVTAYQVKRLKVLGRFYDRFHGS